MSNKKISIPGDKAFPFLSEISTDVLRAWRHKRDDPFMAFVLTHLEKKIQQREAKFIATRRKTMDDLLDANFEQGEVRGWKFFRQFFEAIRHELEHRKQHGGIGD